MTEPPVAAGGQPVMSGPATTASERRDRIGWGRAIMTALLFVVVGFIAVVWLPDLVLQHATSIGRATRVLVAAGLSFAMLILLSWAMRLLQARGRI